MSQQIPCGKRIISGILTASMSLSLFTGFSSARAVSAEHVGKDGGQKGIEQAASKWNSEGAGIAMPLMLDKDYIGFGQGIEENEVTAYMTDIQYLGLDLDEYAAFFPASLDLNKAEYLTWQQR